MDRHDTLRSLGQAIRQHRIARGLTTVDVSRHSGRSRDILHRLENGRDVSAAALLDILRAIGMAVQVVPAGLPSLEEMRQRFADEDDDAA